MGQQPGDVRWIVLPVRIQDQDHVPAGSANAGLDAGPVADVVGRRITLAPAAAAWSAVPSLDASSTTRISASGHCALAPATTRPIVSPSLNAGITMLTEGSRRVGWTGSVPGVVLRRGRSAR